MANNLHIFLDLGVVATNRSAVEEKVKSLGGWARLTPSFWYVDSIYTASEARDFITPAVKDGDIVFVVNASDGQAAWRGVGAQVTEFIKEKWSK